MAHASESAAFHSIQFHVDEGVGWLVMNRPQVRNGLNEEMVSEMLRAIRLAAADDTVRIVVLTGAGTAFCSGADLGNVNTDQTPQKLAEQGQKAMAFMSEYINPLVKALYHFDKPVISAVNGPAVGGGIGLALTADIVVATASAKFICKFTPLMALIPDLGSSWMFPRLIGRARTLGFTLLGEAIDAPQAEEWGLIWKSYPQSHFMESVRTMATQLATGPRFAMSALKRLLRQSLANDFDGQLRLEMEFSAQCAASADFAEAVRAFLAKRTPIFDGKSTS